MNALFSNQRIRIFSCLWLVLLFIGIGLIFFIASSPANASIINRLGAPATATQENLWAYADVPKPTYTATALVVPTIPAVTETPGSLVMEILENTSVPAAQESVSQPVVSYGGSQYILVDISEQHMYVYEGDVLIHSFVASTGIENSTRIGTFAVQTKLPNAYASTWNLWMPNWLGIYYSHGLENGIHALPILSNGATLWAGFLGRPVSYGCVVLGTYEAQILYDWAEMGTPVEIQW
jgi:lipoprotein-anchoring transpeptidase ErfK/SrfK